MARALFVSPIVLAFAQATPVELVLTADPPAVVVEQPVTVRLELRVREDALTRGLVQLSAARLDVPVALEAPWSGGLPDAPLHRAADTGGDMTLALGGARARVSEAAPIERDGARIRTFVVERTLLPLTAGPLTLTADARYATATAFEEQLFGDPVPRDRTDGHAMAALTIPVAPWPAADRPASFDGAVGEFRLHARADFGDAETIAIGDAFELAVTIEGRGNLDRLTAPALSPSGFHVRGWIERPRARTDERTFVYELERTDAAARVVPALEIAYLDPGPPPRYRVLSTDPIPLPGAAMPDDTARGLGAGISIAAGALLAALAAAAVVLRRRSRG